MNEKNEIILFENQGVKLEVNLKDETVWLNRQQLSELFDRDIKTICEIIFSINLLVSIPLNEKLFKIGFVFLHLLCYNYYGREIH